MIYGPAVMNAEVLVSASGDFEAAETVGIGQNRKEEIRIAKEAWPGVLEYREITQRALLYSLQKGEIDAAVEDITKAAAVPELPAVPLSGQEYVSYVLVADREFAGTEAFADLIRAYNEAAEKLNDSALLAERLGVDVRWMEGKKIRFLKLKEPGDRVCQSE